MHLKTVPKYILVWGLLTFILLEISLRLLGFKALQIPDKFIESQPKHCIVPDSILGFKLSPGRYEVMLNNQLKYTVHHNQISERNTFDKNEEDLKKIFIYGCSYTYGMGIEDDESYPYILDQALTDYKIHNKAAPGYGTTQTLIDLQNNIKNNIYPDIVILSYYQFHDERNILNRLYREKLYLGKRINADIYKNNTQSWNFPYYNLADAKIKNTNIHDIYSPAPFREHSALINVLETQYNRISSNEDEARKVSYEIIKKISLLCKEHGIEFFLAYMDEPNQDLYEFCKSEDISLVDSYVNLKQKEYRNLPHDYHPSPIAHKEYAQILLNFFTQKNIH